MVTLFAVWLEEAHNRQVHRLQMGSSPVHFALGSIRPEPCFFPQHKTLRVHTRRQHQFAAPFAARPATPGIAFQTQTIPASATVTVPTPHLARDVRFSIV